ncbi:hypothetical protein FRC04_007577 [Tulasnella sp. 424]|nr:hypothetical protein FRC04_007577 [Tulasnella sp. 424]KAG8979012.1 hypothetical protein FRC05_009222 [Tulasnella sp. 425]
MFKAAALGVLCLSTFATASQQLLEQQSANVDSCPSCPGYTAKNVKIGKGTLSANLVLAGTACNAYGPDVQNLKLAVTYEDETRIHVKITDAKNKRYEVPDEIFKRPSGAAVDDKTADIKFNYKSSPFSFTITRVKTGEVLFDSSAGALVFEPQYLRLKTKLPNQANIYGLGEHTDSFRLNPTNTTRTLWNRDAPGVAQGSNLYGSHPIYFEHRTSGTHGVLLMNSDGMDVILRDGSLEYNVIGGVFDFYFFSGPSPVQVAQQYATLIGKPAEVPYWSLGFHQCRWGYHDYVEVANVVTNYSAAGIPLETMWTDIDYMYKYWTFTNDPEHFPTEKMREITDYLHKHNQQYIVMIDPAVAYQPNQNYGAFDRGVRDGAFLKFPNGTLYQGTVWPGPTVYPDWFHPNATKYWTGEIQRFFDPKTGIDIDGLWIDMNEAANFCDFCADPPAFVATAGNPPPRPAPPVAIDTQIFQKRQTSSSTTTSSTENVLNPPYAIHSAFDQLSQRTIRTDLIHANGLKEYDTHNLYGFMMSMNSQKGMEARRPGKRTLVITRSTFAGAGAKVGKWLGDNLSTWDHYRWSISGQLGMASIYQIPMVGSDICGFGGDTTETLCARWAMLGAFSPFMRNHNDETSISQEFYRWPTVAEAAKKAIAIRYQFLDYIYTYFHRQSTDGTPLIGPMWFQYPTDQNTYPIDLQFFYGDSVLVSPVTQESSTSVDIYLPKDIFYDYFTFAPVQGAGAKVSLSNVTFTDIPLHIRGGGILPMRVDSAMTTTTLRQKDFQIVVAPNASGTATGYLYIDDGVSLSQSKTTDITFQYAKGTLKASGEFNYNVGSVKIAKVVFLGVKSQPKGVSVSGSGAKSKGFKWDAATSTVTVNVAIPLEGGFSVTLKA